MRKIVSLISIFIIIISSVYAELEVTGIKDVYSAGEQLKIKITVTNNYDQDKYFLITDTLTSDNLYPMPFTRKEHLLKQESLSFISLDIEINPQFNPGIYIYNVTVVSEDSEIESYQKSFEIINKYQTFENFWFELCDVPGCYKSMQYFIKSSSIYLKVFGTESGDLKATLTLPDNTKKPIILTDNSANLKLDQLGKYIIEITNSKKSYISRTLQKEFFVTEESAQIEPLFQKEKDYPYSILITAIVIFISLLIGIILWNKRR